MANQKFVLGVDFGTTFSSVSYYICPKSGPRKALPKEVMTIKNWPWDGATGDRTQVPTELRIPSHPESEDDHLEEMVYRQKSNEHPFASQSQQVKTMQNDTDQNDDDEDMEIIESADLFFGYEVFQKKYMENSARDPKTLAKRFKLCLVDAKYTEQERVYLTELLQYLRAHGIIRKFGCKTASDERDVLDIITDFLVKLLEHTKSELSRLHGFSDNSQVEFAITVPTAWSPGASRILQTALQTAAKAVKFGKIAEKESITPYIISEPEAAATYMLAGNNDVLPNECFVIADCGGGTVDMTTYGISNSYPLRLTKEMVEPGADQILGDNCGSSFLNENYRNLVMERLATENYLFRSESLEMIVNRLLHDFETEHKRRIDSTLPVGQKFKVFVPGLRASEKKRFTQNILWIHNQDIHRIWDPLLERVRKVLADQLIAAFKSNIKITKVFLLGGFGISPALISYIQNYLRETSQKLGYDIILKSGNNDQKYSVTAVSTGAVLAALNKHRGPARIAQSSFGFLRAELFNPRFTGHRDGKIEKCDIDGEEYVDTIKYFMKKGELVSARHFIEPLLSTHTFPIDAEAFICEELLYISDTAAKSHYGPSHVLNKDAQLAGSIRVDMTYLRDQRRLEPTISPCGGQNHYKIDLELHAAVEGKELRYFVKYPAGKEGRVKVSDQMSIAAAFLPGTG
ncbi:hypothetical protein ACMFMG_002337 [Clarireedia jacksonii]